MSGVLSERTSTWPLGLSFQSPMHRAQGLAGISADEIEERLLLYPAPQGERISMVCATHAYVCANVRVCVCVCVQLPFLGLKLAATEQYRRDGEESAASLRGIGPPTAALKQIQI